MKKHPPHWRLEEVLPRNGIKAIGPAPAIVWLFLGEVYEGDVGDESRPLQPKFPTQKIKTDMQQPYTLRIPANLWP